MRTHWKYGALLTIGTALAFGGGCSCPGSVLVSDGYGNFYPGSLYAGPGVLTSWTIGGYQAADAVGNGPDDFDFDGDIGWDPDDYKFGPCCTRDGCISVSDMECILRFMGRPVYSCGFCSSFGRVDATMTIDGLFENDTYDIAFTESDAKAAFLTDAGYTTIALRAFDGLAVVQLIVPGTLTDTHDIYGTDGKRIEASAVFVLGTDVYSTVADERIELGTITLEGEYPEVGGTLAGTFSTKVFGPNGEEVQLSGDFRVPFVNSIEDVEITPYN